jgi:MoxR-like ATPase
LEFPNDLLWELDQMEFYIHETQKTIKTKYRPIVIITSNAEKELPDAFLRRCIFHYIDFPETKLMEEIIKTHFDHVEDNLLKAAMDSYYRIREIRDIIKKPSTSELIDWIQALMVGGITVEEIQKELPFVGVIVKKDEDLEILKHKI